MRRAFPLSMRRGGLVAALGFVSTLAGSAAAAPSATDAALAQALFDEGRALVEAGKYSEACPKLSLSNRLDPGGGTLLNLALCHDNEGALALAWTEYTDALAQARRDHREDRIAFAEAHLGDLEQRLPHVRIVLRGPPLGVNVTLDDVVIDTAAIGLAMPVNPGRHVVKATANGKVPWSRELTVGIGESGEIGVPELAISPRTAEPEKAQPSIRRPVGWAIVGIGAIGVVGGAVVGILALNKSAQTEQLCPSNPCTNPEGVRASENAVTFAWIANGSIAGGVVAIAVGTYLVLTAPATSAPAARPSARSFVAGPAGMIVHF